MADLRNGKAINDPNAHLVCYQVKGANLSPRPKVEVSTQFRWGTVWKRWKGGQVWKVESGNGIRTERGCESAARALQQQEVRMGRAANLDRTIKLAPRRKAAKKNKTNPRLESKSSEFIFDELRRAANEPRRTLSHFASWRLGARNSVTSGLITAFQT